SPTATSATWRTSPASASWPPRTSRRRCTGSSRSALRGGPALLHERQPRVPDHDDGGAAPVARQQRRGRAGRARGRPRRDRRPRGHPRAPPRGRSALSVAALLPPRRRAPRSPWYVVVPAVLVGAATLLPLVYLVVRALELDVATLLELA